MKHPVYRLSYSSLYWQQNDFKVGSQQSRGFSYPWYVWENISERSSEELSLLAWIFHADHVKELKCLDGRITEKKNQNLIRKDHFIQLEKIFRS